MKVAVTNKENPRYHSVTAFFFTCVDYLYKGRYKGNCVPQNVPYTTPTFVLIEQGCPAIQVKFNN